MESMGIMDLTVQPLVVAVKTGPSGRVPMAWLVPTCSHVQLRTIFSDDLNDALPHLNFELIVDYRECHRGVSEINILNIGTMKELNNSYSNCVNSIIVIAIPIMCVCNSASSWRDKSSCPY